LFRLIFIDLQNMGVISAAPCMLTAEIFKTQILCTIQAMEVQPMDCEAVLVSHGHICKLHAHTHILKVTQ
jgi:hypothetical protein